jgi:hypothetical protein
MKTPFPFYALAVGIFADAVEILATPFIGYFLAIPLDIYLYRWAGKYLNTERESAYVKTSARHSKIKNSLIFRIALEYIPIVNLLPISTIFVLLAYRDKVKMTSIDNIVNKV